MNYSTAKKQEFSQKTNNIMFIVCFIYVTCTNLIPFLGRASEIVLLLSFIFILKKTSYKFIKDGLFITLLISILVIVTTWLKIKLTHPELSSDIPDIRYFSRFMLFIPIAYWLQGKENKIIFIWCSFIVSTFISTFTRGSGISEWRAGLSGTRVDFGIINAQHTALLMATILIISLFYILNILNREKESNINSKGIKTLAAAIMIVLSTLGLLISQTRGIWLAVIISTTMISTLYLTRSKLSLKHIIIFLIVALPVIISGYKYEGKVEQIISKRIISEDYVIIQALNSGVDSLPYTSIGIRLHSWNESLKWIEEKPLLGWGENAKRQIMEKSNFPKWVKDNFRHLHNFYLETTASYGLIGLSILLYLYYFLIKINRNLLIEDQIPKYITSITYTFCAFLFIANFFESYNSMWSGILITNLIFSASYSYHLFGKKE